MIRRTPQPDPEWICRAWYLAPDGRIAEPVARLHIVVARTRREALWSYIRCADYRRAQAAADGHILHVSASRLIRELRHGNRQFRSAI